MSMAYALNPASGTKETGGGWLLLPKAISISLVPKNRTLRIMPAFLYLIGVIVFPFCLIAAEAVPSDPSAIQRQEMRKAAWMVGDWKGTGWIEMGPMGRHEFVQTEAIQSKLDGLVLIIEGLGQSREDASTVHSALAVLSYDERAGTFRWRAFTAEGRQTDAEAKVDEGALEWGFPTSRTGRVRFTIKLDEKGRWFEIGEMTQDGETWRQFFEMTLQRQGQ